MGDYASLDWTWQGRHEPSDPAASAPLAVRPCGCLVGHQWCRECCWLES